MSSGDGKLIVITTNNVVNPAGGNEWPLTHLPIYFPIPPAEINYAKSAEHSEQQVVRKGTVSQFGGPGLEVVSWDGEFVEDAWLETMAVPEYVVSPPSGMTLLGAYDLKSILRALEDRGHIFNLSVQDQQTGRLEFFKPVTIRQFDFKDTGGEPDHRFYSISFTEYRFLKIRNVPRGGLPPTSGTNRPPIHRFVPNPWRLPYRMGIKRASLIAYHDQSQWKWIYEANGGKKGMIKKGATYDPKAKYGPWILPKNARLFIPITTMKPQPR